MATISLGAAIQRGLASARPASGDATKAGQLYYATDMEELSHDDGTSWAVVATNVDAATLQPLDSDLTTLAGLTATTDNLIQAVGSAWASRTPGQVRTALGLVVGTDVEAHDADLSAIAGLSPSNDDVLQRKGGAWANRTLAQLKTDLALNPLTTQDDLYVGGASGAPARLAKGTDGQVLAVDPTTHHLVWIDPPSGGVPDGGSTGQVLTKQSGTDGDADWADPTGEGGALPITVGGDLLYFSTGSPTYDNLATTLEGASASASDSFGSTPPSRAIDMDDATEWWSGSGDGIDRWLQVDLGTARPVGRFRALQHNTSSARTDSYQIQHSDDASVWETDYEYAGDAPHESGNVNFATVTARYWRFLCTAHTSNGIGLQALELREGSTDGAPDRLPIGDEGALLIVVDGAPSWLAPGTEGQTLTMASGYPAWVS